jgi:hypothetical protein
MLAAGGFFPFKQRLGKTSLRLWGRESPCARQEDVQQAGDASEQLPSTWAYYDALSINFFRLLGKRVAG